MVWPLAWAFEKKILNAEVNAYHNYNNNNILGEGEEGKFLSKFRKIIKFITLLMLMSLDDYKFFIISFVNALIL